MWTCFACGRRCEVVSIAARDFLQLFEKSAVVKRSFQELKSAVAGGRPSVFVADRPAPKPLA